MPSRQVTITVLFNDAAQDPRLQTAHGMSCLIEGLSKTVLFDTGGDGHILLENMEILGKDPKTVDTVVISHAHWDHSGGLFTFLRGAEAENIEVFFPKAVSRDFRDHAAFLGATVHVVDKPVEVVPGIRSTGQMGGKELPPERREQSLVLDGADGAVVITGCAHPDVVDITRKAGRMSRRPVDLVLGGFHLRDSKAAVVAQVIRDLQGMGVRRLGASHCTGDRHMAAFRRAWKGEFVDFGCGAALDLAMR